MPTEDIEQEKLSSDDDSNDDSHDVEYITSITTSDHWKNFRNSLAQDMFNGWRASGRQI